VLRPTWHFVHPEDIRWLLQLTAPHVHALSRYPYRLSGLDPSDRARTRRLIERALQGGQSRTRKELAAILDRDRLGGTGLRMACIMMNAELEGVVCSGPLRGKQHTYALLEERVPPARALARDEALAELARRFFAGHAPATLQHFAWWSGLSVRDAKSALAMVEHKLWNETVGDRTFWSDPDPVRVRSRTGAYLIPEYDESLTGYRDLGVPDAGRPRGFAPKGDGSFRPVILGGQRVGTWKRTLSGSGVTVHANLFTRLNGVQTRALQAAVRRFGAFLQLPVTLQ
jgi:hypothetical protein